MIKNQNNPPTMPATDGAIREGIQKKQLTNIPKPPPPPPQKKK